MQSIEVLQEVLYQAHLNHHEQKQNVILAPDSCQIHTNLSYNKDFYCFAGPTMTKLCNWSECVIYLNSYKFKSSEPIIFAIGKAAIFKDDEVLEEALSTKDIESSKAKALGRKVVGFDEQVWSRESLWISDLTLLQKALQNDDVMKELLSTGSRVIVEAAKHDLIWGAGLGAVEVCNSRQEYPWKGRNELGNSWARVRKFLVNTFEANPSKSSDIDLSKLTSIENINLFFTWF